MVCSCFLITIALSSWFNWKTVKTDNFTVFYKPGYSWEAYQTLQNSEYYHDFGVTLTGNETRNVPVVVEDIGILSNGYADPFLYTIHIFTYPQGLGSVLDGNENWYRAVVVHEFIHTGHLTKTTGFSTFLTRLFGSPFQPNMYSPVWLIEGLAVFGESNVSPYEGRLNDGFFSSYIGTRVYEKGFPSLVEITNEPLSFPLGGIYLYGGEFFRFLSYRYGEDRFRTFFSSYGSYFWAPIGTLTPFLGIDLAARRTYGKSFPVLYTEWKMFAEYRNKDWRMEGEQITKKGWYISSMTKSTDKIYYTRLTVVKPDAFFTKSIIEIVEHTPSTGKERTIANLTSSVSSPIKVRKNTLYYTTMEMESGQANVYRRGYGATSSLHMKDLTSGEDRIILTDEIRAFCVLPDNSVLYSKDKDHSFGSELWIFDGHEREKVIESPRMIMEMDANNTLVVFTAARDYENSDLFLFDLETLELTPLFSSPWREGYLHLTENNQLLFSANFNGNVHLYQLTLNNDSLYQLTSHGYSQSSVLWGDTIIYVGLNTTGFDLYRTEYSPEISTPPDDAPSKKPSFDLNEESIAHGGYTDVLKTLRPVVHVPLLFPDDDTWTEWYFGALFVGGDATVENFYTFSLAYDAEEDTPIFQGTWESLFFSPLYLSLDYDNQTHVYTRLDYPLLYSLRPGISNISLYLNLLSGDEFQRKEISPGVVVRLFYPFTSVTFNAYFPFERERWRSSIDRNAQSLTVTIRQMVKEGELKLVGISFSDIQNPDTVSLPVRGYEEILASKGFTGTIEYSHKLMGLRKGLWNPNIYFEDIFGTLFFDYGFDHTRESFYSFGIEMSIESKIAFGYIQLLPAGGVVINREGEVSSYFQIRSATQSPYFRTLGVRPL
jgi:hypothetical protein